LLVFENQRRDFFRTSFGVFGFLLFPDGLLSYWNKYDNFEDKKEVISPSRLQKGDVVAVMGAAGALRETKYIESFKEQLLSFGFKVIMGETVGKINGYFSGTDEERAQEFNRFIEDQSVKAIFFIKGGWGSARILNLIDYENIKKNPKIILGFSDITSLLIAVFKKTRLVTFHGPVGVSSWEGFTLESFKNMTCRAEKKLNQNDSEIRRLITVIVKGQAKGQLIGGNLSVFVALLGTPFFESCKEKILFLEETDEEPYRIDRMLTTLRLAGVLDEVAGIVFGQFNKCIAEKPQESFTLIEVLEQHFKEACYPVVYGCPFGHVKDKWTLPVGAEAIIDTDGAVLTLFAPAVH